MPSTMPATPPRFQVAPDDCTAVVDSLFTSGSAYKVLCRAIDGADAAYIARTCSAHGPLVAAARAAAAVFSRKGPTEAWTDPEGVAMRGLLDALAIAEA